MEARFREVLEESLEESGKILMKHYGRLKRVEHKGELDLVTTADRESEEKIVGILRKAFPEHALLAEESGVAEERRSEYVWIIDPLDGTTNYSHSFTAFCVSVALERKGEIIMGGVHAPFHGEMFYAERGGGAQLNGKRIEVSGTERLSDSLMVTGFPYDRRENIDHYLEYVRRFLLRAQGVLRVGAAALDLCYVACGRLDGFWEEKLHPWDTAAGKLIVEEAGGRMTDFEGRAFSPYGKQMVASNGLIHEEILGVIRGES